MIEILLLALIPAAAWTGWILAKSKVSRGERKRNRSFSNLIRKGMDVKIDDRGHEDLSV